MRMVTGLPSSTMAPSTSMTKVFSRNWGTYAVLESTVRRIERHLRGRGRLGIDEDGADPDVPGDPESNRRRWCRAQA